MSTHQSACRGTRIHRARGRLQEQGEEHQQRPKRTEEEEGERSPSSPGATDLTGQAVRRAGQYGLERRSCSRSSWTARFLRRSGEPEVVDEAEMAKSS